MLRLRLDRLYPAVHHLIVELGQVVAFLQALNVLLSKLVRILMEALRMVYINISVIIIDHNDSSAVGYLFHVLRVVRVLLLLLVQVMLVKGLLGHANLV